MSEELLTLILLRILLVLAVCCTFAAIFFITWPKSWIEKANAFFNKWISTKTLMEKLETMMHTDDYCIRIRKFLGLIALALAAMLFYLWFKY